MLKKLTIVGTGSWATALVKLFSENGIRVSWLVRTQEFADYFRANGRNPRYLSYAQLKTECIDAVTEPGSAIKNTDLVLFAVPSAYLKDTLKGIDKDLLTDKQVAVSIKGFIPGSGYTPSRFISEYIGSDKYQAIVLGGPCHAEEVANQKSTYITIGTCDPGRIKVLKESISNHYIHAISNDDPVGIEYASILKNIIAVASGIASGLHYGDNFQAVLVANSMREAGRFISSVEPGSRDLFQSAYFGDLLVTAYSEYSRNRTLGKLVGRGFHVNKALGAMEMIAEGFYASKELALLLRQSKLNLPVINAVHRILHQHANPFHEFKLLEGQLT